MYDERIYHSIYFPKNSNTFSGKRKKTKQMKAKAKYPKAYLGTCQTSLGVIIKYIRKIFRKTNKAATKRVL